MGEKKTPRLTPEENEKRQAARAEKRQQYKDAQTIALLAVLLDGNTKRTATDYDLVEMAAGFLSLAKENVARRAKR